MRAMRAGVLTAIGVLLICRAAGATGLLMPEDRRIPPLAVKSHRVSVQVKDGVATTKLTQVFQNSTNQRLEATYVFPIPVEAALTDFAMYINGKRQGGQVVEADKARRIYEDIVRRMRDPGLLEYMGSRLLKMRVFPIEPKSTQRIEVSYAYALPFDNGVYRYTFPLRTGEKASSVIEDSTFSVEIASKQPIVNIYSPTHEVGISTKGEHSAVVGFEEEGAKLDKDFVLYYGLGNKDFGLNLLTYRPEGQDGYFALMLAPRVELEEEKVMPKDVCFLVDVSGSMMQENRIASAREALKFCLNSLNAKDRFALVPFSTGVDVFGEGLMDATKENVEKAVACADKLEARGGTALCGAVVKGLQTAPPEADRPYIVVLVTDGKPTIGTVEPDDIIAEVKAVNKANVRVFTFGIAESLDVPLLDRIAEITRGYSEYVTPGREIETEISSFFRKVSYPVLANLKLDFGKVKVLDMYPQELPDLFRGSRVLAFGRYSDGGLETAYYQNDFEGAVGPEWSSSRTDVTPKGNRRFLGQFGDGTVTLSLDSLPAHDQVNLSFDLFVIRSWDGNGHSGPDIWELKAERGPTLLRTTFSNSEDNPANDRQAYPAAYPGGDHPARAGAAEVDSLGYGRDTCYRLSCSFAHSGDNLTLKFAAKGTQPIADESWGLDNVRVTAHADVPSPDRVTPDKTVHVAVKLTGTVGGKEKEFAYDADFPEVAGDNEFIPHLWAQRKIAYLLDEIRLHGENRELKDEVIRLSKEYGIATPYTSYLVLEDEDAYRRHGIVSGDFLGAARAAAPAAVGGQPEREEARFRMDAARNLKAAGSYFEGAGKAADESVRGGEGAVRMSQTMRAWKGSRTSGGAGLSRVEATLKNVAGKTFVRIRGVFIDTVFEEGMKTLKLKWGSDAYFAALRAMPELAKYLALGENVIVVIEGKALIVGEQGEEQLSEQEITKFFE